MTWLVRYVERLHKHIKEVFCTTDTKGGAQAESDSDAVREISAEVSSALTLVEALGLPPISTPIPGSVGMIAITMGSTSIASNPDVLSLLAPLHVGHPSTTFEDGHFRVRQVRMLIHVHQNVGIGLINHGEHLLVVHHCDGRDVPAPQKEP